MRDNSPTSGGDGAHGWRAWRHAEGNGHREVSSVGDARVTKELDVYSRAAEESSFLLLSIL